MRKLFLFFLLQAVFYTVILMPSISLAQPLPSIPEKTKGLSRIDGYFPFYKDDQNGKIWLELNKLDTEILYAMSLPSGLGSNDIGLDRGLMGGGRIVKFSRIGKKILMTEPNYGYRAFSASAKEKEAVDLAFAKSTLWAFAVEAESDGSVLVDATEFLTRDAMQAANRIRKMQQGNYSLDRNRSALYFPSCKNFPFNTELEATITLVSADGVSGNFIQPVVPSPEAITLRMHHSFVQLPDGNYTPRKFDPRSSFNNTSYYDYSSPVSTPIEKYVINRHRLSKKDPSAKISEPVKPIVYYLDNGTPEPIRTALLKGGNWWNQAFEAAGYKDAFIVKILPDSCDPMDIRYNMINWVHRSTRGWSYGASVVDPRTGEIIKGQVSLGSLRVRQDYMIAQGLLSPFGKKDMKDDPMLKMSLDRLEQLSAHEIGHTLGLMHNYAASTVDRSSVMDYPHPLIKLNKKGEFDFSDAYDLKIGDWDKVSIAWGYADLSNSKNEAAELDKILTDAYAKGLKFISDRDARAPGGLHPEAHLWDNGKEPIATLEEMINMRAVAMKQFGINSIRNGMPMAMLEDVLVPVYFHHRYQVEAAIKLIGGMHYNYALKGDGQSATAILSKDIQAKAMASILKCLEPSFLAIPESIAALIPPRPAGYEFTRELFKKKTGLSFDQLAPAEAAADLPLSFLFNPERINRLVQHELQGQYGFGDMCNALIEASFKAQRKSGLEKAIQFQTEQLFLTYLLSASIDEQLSFPAKSRVGQVLTELKSWLEASLKTANDPLYKAHLGLAIDRFKSPEKAKPTIHAVAPPGAPIGCEEEMF